VTAPGGGWSIERRVGTARALHEPWPAPTERRRRTVALCSLRGPRAVVLGSTQSIDVVDLQRSASEGVDVVRRRSGGGAVLVGAGEQVWVEVWIPRDDALWDDDVIRSSWWLGESWKRALEELGAPGLLVHRRRSMGGDWSDLVCFAGIGPGEVLAGTAKVVGVAQRRTREGARLHSMAPMSWEPAPLVALLALDPLRARLAHDALGDVATGVRGILPPSWCDTERGLVASALEDALVSALP